MSEKPEALRLADILFAQAHRDDASDIDDFRYRAAAELRRQHAEIERLHDELRQSSIDIARAENERLREALALAERLAAGRLAMVEQLAGEVEALRREDV